jgi:hypothetical protein
MPPQLRQDLNCTTMNKLLSCLICLLLLSPAMSHADGGVLLRECSELFDSSDEGLLDTSRVGASYCMGMVNGMMALNAVYRSQPGSNALFCPERTVTTGEGAKVVINYLNRHPEELTLDAPSLMLFALREAYPCPRG